MRLLPCPTCGKEVVMGKDGLMFRVTCGSCGMHTLSYEEDEDVVAAWNSVRWRDWLNTHVKLDGQGKFQVLR